MASGETARVIVGTVFVTSAIALMAYGAREVDNQDRLIKGGRPVPATVQAATVESRTTSGGRNRTSSTTYQPRVTFEYVVDGRPYSAETVTPIDVWGSLDWASGLAAGFPPGSRVTAYHDPGDPSRAFLHRTFQFDPYLFVLFPTGHLCAGLALLFGPRLKARRTLALALAVWCVVGGTFLGHYFANVEASTPLARGVAWVYAGLALLLVLILLAAVRHARRQEREAVRQLLQRCPTTL